MSELEGTIRSLVSEVRSLRLEIMTLKKELSNCQKKDFMTLKEACDYLNVSRTTIQKRLADGEICFAVKKGKSWLFPSDKLKDYASGF